jgi:hypothetical protein
VRRYVVHLDDLLPLLVDRATNSNSRKVKLSACEALHATVTALVARTSAATEDASASLWRPVFAAILRLACDVEAVVSKMFDTLMLQVVRWVSGGHGVPKAVQKAVFDCVLDELVNPESSSMRKVAAKSVAEIFEWSVKETTKRELLQNRDNAVAVLMQRTCNLAIHPDKYVAP